MRIRKPRTLFGNLGSFAPWRLYTWGMKEQCGLCGNDGVRFEIPEAEADCVLCAGCVQAAVAAHAGANRFGWASQRRARDVRKRLRECREATGEGS